MFINKLLNINIRQKKPKGRRLNYIYLLWFSLLTVIVTGILAFYVYHYNKIYPNVTVAGVDVGGLTVHEASMRLQNRLSPPQGITIFVDNYPIEIPFGSISFANNYSGSALTAFQLFRSGNPLQNFVNQLKSLYIKQSTSLEIILDQEKLDETILSIANQVQEKPINPSISINNGVILVDKGKIGKKIDASKLKAELINNLSWANYSPINAPFISVDPTLSDHEISKLEERAEKLLGKTLVLTNEYDSFVLRESDILSFLAPHDKYWEEVVSKAVNDLSKTINRNPQNAVFMYKEGQVKEFLPAKEGIVVNEEELTNKIIKTLQILESSEGKTVEIEIPVQTTPPTVTTDQVNSLGINELIGRGSSKFAGSISSRIYNIGIASSKLNGSLISPGEIFSTNKTLGDISTQTGYKQAYIIKDGETILDDGGGVCQVSTTLFRAVLDAGLPVFERQAHAYRVNYYEQDSLPGFDATIYHPTTDFKFKNDTSGHILIQTLYNQKAKSLVFELYGTSDGRTASTTKPVITDVTPPPEDLYIDDPNLPLGTVKQIDWKAWGAKVWFDYSVKKEGEVIYKKRFYSIYQPWQAKYLKGTGNSQ
jgi:vancomycin resistance protein YoaR